MSWQSYRVTVRLPGTIGKRQTATRRITIYADSHEDAIAKAKLRLVNAASYEVRCGS